MAYFPNGTSGLRYQEDWCCRCEHYHDDEPENYCPILFCHEMLNYRQCGSTPGDKELKAVLEAMIPTRKDGFPDRCKMFVPNGDVPGQLKMFDEKGGD